VVSFSFRQLESYLGGGAIGQWPDDSEFRTSQRIAQALRAADWLVFVMLDVSPGVPSSTIVRSFLENQSTLVNRMHVVVIALGAPVYLSSTEISTVAYLGLYSSIRLHRRGSPRALSGEQFRGRAADQCSGGGLRPAPGHRARSQPDHSA
jgi:hypothetical protein